MCKPIVCPPAGTLTPDGKLHGRGACDTKATLAVLCALLGSGKPLMNHLVSMHFIKYA